MGCWALECSWLSVGGDLRRGVCLQRERVDRAADLRPEDRVHETVLLDAAETCERRRGDARTEVIATAGVVLDVGARPRNGGLDALLYVLCGRHSPQE